MTLPFERKMAVTAAEKFLIRLMDHEDKEIAREARSILRHFPTSFYIEEAARLAPSVFGSMPSRIGSLFQESEE